jgi:hypothetical protein
LALHAVKLSYRRNVEDVADALDCGQEIFVANEGEDDEEVDGGKNVEQEATSQSLLT